MRRVFDGGVGGVSGGIVERSKESGVRDLDEGPDDMVGELSADIIELVCLFGRTKVDVVESDGEDGAGQLIMYGFPHRRFWNLRMLRLLAMLRP